MATPRRPPGRRGGRWAALARRSPALVLLVSLLLTFVATGVVAQSGRARDQARFQNAVEAATDRIRGRFETYVALLDGAAALFATDEVVTGAGFRTYVEHLDVPARYPGVRGIGYSALLHAAGAPARFDAAAALGTLRAAGSPATRLWPQRTGERPSDEVHAIAYLYPLDRRNRAALGFDMHTEPQRRAAMDQARDTGRPAASGRVTLVQEITPGATQPGFLVYVPVYRGGATPATVDARRRALAGFVYAPFRTGDLLRGIFGSERRPRVAFRIFDGPDTTAAALLADSRALPASAAADDERPQRPRALVPLDVASRRWTIAFSPVAGADFGSRDGLAALVGLLGIAVSIALALVTATEVRARERVEQSDALRGRFFAAMSHELRTPVNAVLGYNDLLLAGIYGDLADTQRDGIQRSQRAARHLLELVNDVLDLSKLEAGKVDLALEDVTLPDLLDDLLVTIGPLAAARGCALRLDAASCDATICTDPRRLRQILLNLLSNATKFSAGRPVEVACVVEPGNGTIAVHVRDEGPGIAPADQARVFEEFVQLPGAAAGGTGLGLAISRQLAELLGGTLTVHSALGAGATFTLRLPFSAPGECMTRGADVLAPAASPRG